jgi:hypothetical protein
VAARTKGATKTARQEVLKEIVNTLARIISVALGLALLPIASVVAAQFVVIDSTSPSYVAGTIIDDVKTLSIHANERITVVAEDGKTRTIEGPFEGVVDSDTGGTAGGRGLIQTLSKLVVADQSRSRIGAVRGVVAAPVPDDIFLVRVDYSGQVCLAGSAAMLWRPNAAYSGILLIREIGGENRKTEVNWPAGARQLAWPQELQPQEAMSYLLRFRDSTRRATRINVAFVDRAAPTTAHQIAILAEKKCLQQAGQLLKELVGEQ